MKDNTKDVAEQLKVRLIVMFQRKGDAKVLVTKGRSYTGNQLAEEIKNETETGIHYMETALALTVDLLARDKMNYDEEREKLDSEKELFFAQRLSDGTIQVELYGDDATVATLVCDAMAGNDQVAAVVCAAIPSFIDKTGRSREGYCKMVMNSVGQKGGNNA